MPHDLWHEIHEFLAMEARLLDERRLDEWLDLLTDDVFYWMPVRNVVSRDDSAREVNRPGELAMFEETKESLGIRISRLRLGSAWAEDPPARTRHLITNLEVAPGPKDGEAAARTAFMLYRTTLEREVEMFAGCRDDVLRKEGGAWRLARRKVVLDQTVVPAKSLSTFF